MAQQNVQNKDMGGLVLSSDAKPRLKWTPELHQRFIDAVNQLGGADKATPKSLMRVMGIHGLTLYHLKSHLQKFRLGKSQQPQTYNENKPAEEVTEINQSSNFADEICEGTQTPINESLQIAQALQMQMEVQRKLYEQIEVQRHLQLRIEAQGKYLQSVLKKAQETLAGYNASGGLGVELAKAELSQLVSMVDISCSTSSLSAITEIEGSMLKEPENKQVTGHGCSVESSLTSSESSGRKEKGQPANESDETDKWRRNSVVLSLMDMKPGQNSVSDNKTSERKRNGSNISDNIRVEKPLAKRFQSQNSDEQPRKFGFLDNLDLNSKYLNDFDSGPKTLDLNCQGVDKSNGYI